MQHELLAKVVEALDAAGIKHMVTGSFASTFHGEPRMTQDINVSATERRGMFNVIDVTTGWKADLIIRKDRAFSEEEFSRRLPVRIADVATYVASSEDTILSKLEWSAKSGSERQLRDVVSVVQVQRPTLDFDYLEHWATELGIADELQAALDASA